MSRNQEALDWIICDIKSITTDYINSAIKEEVDILQKLINSTAPPTEQEVCEALSEYLIEFGIIGIHYMAQCFYDYDDYPIIFWDGEGVKIDLYGTTLPPHLITLIGRFYEGVKENE